MTRELTAFENDEEVRSAVRGKISLGSRSRVSLSRRRKSESEASSLFREGQLPTPPFAAKSYFRWKFIALPRTEASFPGERNKENFEPTRAKDNWRAVLSCPFSPVVRPSLRSHPCRFLSGRAARLRKLTIVKCTYASADLLPRGLRTGETRIFIALFRHHGK